MVIKITFTFIGTIIVKKFFAIYTKKYIIIMYTYVLYRETDLLLSQER